MMTPEPPIRRLLRAIATSLGFPTTSTPRADALFAEQERMTAIRWWYYRHYFLEAKRILLEERRSQA